MSNNANYDFHSVCCSIYSGATMQKHLVILLWDLGFGGIQTRLNSILIHLAQKSGQSLKITLLVKRKQPVTFQVPPHLDIEIRAFSQDLYQGKQFQFSWWLLQQLFQLQPTHTLTFSDRFSVLAIIFKFLS